MLPTEANNKPEVAQEGTEEGAWCATPTVTIRNGMLLLMLLREIAVTHAVTG